MTKVLVVEDNPMNMKLAALLTAQRRPYGAERRRCEIGLALARAELPDLILMDFQLPGMDGVTATALLKQDPATAAIPVIGLTATVMDADAEGKPVAGCDAYIAKPLRYQDLYAAMDTLLPKAEWRQSTGVTTPRPFPRLRQNLRSTSAYSKVWLAMTRSWFSSFSMPFASARQTWHSN